MSAREKSKDSVSLLPCFYFVEMPILISSAVSLYFLEWTDIFRPVLVGFSCRDRSLSLPYIEPTHELIPLLMLLSLAFAGPAISIMVGEAVLFCCQSRRSRGAAAEANINAAGCNFNSFIRRAVRFIGVHTFGLCATALITNVLQLMTGNPTPYFLTVCKPNYSSLNTSCEQNPYIMEDICTGADQAAISQGRRSFPSQHATLASFAAVYVSMYFNSTLTDSSKLLKPLLVFSYTISAIVCGLTRIIQYKNHAVDVYLGFLLGSAIAVYLGLYAVGNFRPSKEVGRKLPTVLHYPPCSLPHISQEAILHHLKLKASLAGEAPAEVPLHQPQRVGKNVKHSTSDIEVISPRSAHNKDASVTFSHTLPRVHTPQAMAAYEEAARCHAATLHRASIDSSRSKQLLSQWKSKNHHNCSLQVPDFFSSSVDSSSGQSSHHPHHHGSMELRSSSEASAGGLNGSFDHNAYMSKLATGGSTTLPSNCSGITGGARILLQSRPGSSQLVHIPEEGHESNNSASPRLGSEGNEGSAAQMNWQGAAEKVLTCRTTDHSQNPQPRLMQMISVAKQQGLLQTHSKSLDETSINCNTSAGFQGSAHYKAQAIVRVEAHPENKPAFHAPSSDATGSWRWRSLDHGTGVSSFELNNLSRDSESSDSVSENSVTVHTQNSGLSEQGCHQQSLSTIRVTPGDGSSSACGGGGDVASSCESMLQKKANNMALIAERTNSPEPTHNISYKATSIPPGFKD
uniref:Phospholipid phosphatase-related protein type 3 n=1 Tax=Tetraodon nigroviridis TaxID=99883 RepID=H3CI84_TETNG